MQLLLLGLALILILARALGALAARLGQPPVIGEIIAGILLGPTIMHGAIADVLFPEALTGPLTALANIGVALFMFLVGMEIEFHTISGRTRVVAGAALGSVLVPFALGVGLAASLLGDHAQGPGSAFVVFFGLAVSVTAFPVLARILADRSLIRTSLGGIALATAAVVDVVAWIALAILVAGVSDQGGAWHVVLIVLVGAVMMLVVRPLLRRLLTPRGIGAPLTGWTFALVLAGALASGAVTEAIGIHAIFGAFLFGLAMPRQGATAVRVDVQDRVGQLTSLLLPVYFVTAGLKVDLGRLDLADLGQFGVILLVAVLGKFGGTYAGARLQRLPARPAIALATLMNTRGLTELIILGVGLQIGLLDNSLYSLMVAMAVITTVMTGPLLSLIYRKPVETPAPGGTEGSGSATRTSTRSPAEP
ncbi:cation:proton antiporter domain-containing protein [Streptosporangium sp. LJ11]|uniref:cation:proton antiporter domain-containing protein n=1 Tax=Streptosporangium sp. LJ11 TaxID=3436927 RepID=UPI003F7AD137